MTAQESIQNLMINKDQLESSYFGADGEKMSEAAKKIIDWKEPDFIDINFGCPVIKSFLKMEGHHYYAIAQCWQK